MLADDEMSISTIIERIARDDGYDYVYCSDGALVYDMYIKEQPDLIILDVMMPDKNGFDVCLELRQKGVQVPIMFLSAKGDLVDKSIGFKIGCDDYLVKPFAPLELSLRIEALLRRSANIATPSDKNVLVYGAIKFDLAKEIVYKNDKRIDLTRKEFSLLALMASHPNEVFTREQLIEHISGEDFVGEINNITVFVHRIREKIEVDPTRPEYLLTVWRVGYKFNG